MANLWNLELELKALKTILTPTSEYSQKLFSACPESCFYHRISKTLYGRLSQIAKSESMSLPSLEFLISDAQIPKDIRETVTRAFADAVTVESQGDYEYVVKHLNDYARARTIYGATQTTGAAILETDPSQIDKITASLYSKLAEVEQKEEHFELVFGAGYTPETASIYHTTMFGEMDSSFIKTGFREFDEKTGGHRRSNLVVVGANSGGGKCIDFNSLVPTSKGIKRIGELFETVSEPTKLGWVPLEIGIKTRSGIRVTDGIFHSRGQTIRVITDYGDSLIGLPEHKVLRADPDGNLIYTSLGDLKMGDYIAKSCGENFFPIDFLVLDYKMPEYADHNKRLDVTRFPKILEDDLSFFLGLTVAEGHKGKDITNIDRDLIAWVQRFLYTSFGVVREYRQNKRIEFGERISDFVTEFTGKGLSAERYIPKKIFESPKSCQVSFLRGLFEGDASIYVKERDKIGWKLEYVTISERLVYDVKALLENLGILCQVKPKIAWARNGTKKQKRKTAYTLTVLTGSIRRFESEIGFWSSRKKDELRRCTHHLEKVDRDELRQNTNAKTCGMPNHLPVKDLLVKYLERLKVVCKSTDILSVQRTRAGNYHAVLQKAGLQQVLNWTWKQRISNVVKRPKMVVSRYICDRILTMHLCSGADPDVVAAVQEDPVLVDLRKKIDCVSSHLWAQVKAKTPVGERDVYDLSVPGEHEYSVNGLMSHNSLMAVNLMVRQYRMGYNVVMASYEMSREEILLRVLSCISEIPMNDIALHRLTPKQIDKVDLAWMEFNLIGKELGNSFTIACPTVETTVAQVGFRYKNQKIHSLILDYINLLAYDGDLESQWQALGEISKQSKQLAAKLNCVVYLLAQIDDTYNLRYSKAIKDHANFVMGWVRDETALRDRVITVKQMKARNAPLYDFGLNERFDIAQFRDEGQSDRLEWPDSAGIYVRAAKNGLIMGNQDLEKAQTQVMELEQPKIAQTKRISLKDDDEAHISFLPKHLIKAKELNKIDDYDSIKLNVKPKAIVMGDATDDVA